MKHVGKHVRSKSEAKRHKSLKSPSQSTENSALIYTYKSLQNQGSSQLICEIKMED